MNFSFENGFVNPDLNKKRTTETILWPPYHTLKGETQPFLSISHHIDEFSIGISKQKYFSLFKPPDSDEVISSVAFPSLFGSRNFRLSRLFPYSDDLDDEKYHVYISPYHYGNYHTNQNDFLVSDPLFSDDNIIVGKPLEKNLLPNAAHIVVQIISTPFTIKNPIDFLALFTSFFNSRHNSCVLPHDLFYSKYSHHNENERILLNHTTEVAVKSLRPPHFVYFRLDHCYDQKHKELFEWCFIKKNTKITVAPPPFFRHCGFPFLSDSAPRLFPKVCPIQRHLLTTLNALLSTYHSNTHNNNNNFFLCGKRHIGKQTIARHLISHFLCFHTLKINCLSILRQDLTNAQTFLKQELSIHQQSFPCVLLLTNMELLNKRPEYCDMLSRILPKKLTHSFCIGLSTKKIKNNKLNQFFNFHLHFPHQFSLSHMEEILKYFSQGKEEFQSIHKFSKELLSFSWFEIKTLFDLSHFNKETFTRTLGVFCDHYDRFNPLSGTSLSIPKVFWTDIGGLDSVKQVLIESMAHLHTPHKGTTPVSHSRTGIILFGPPGTGKTLLAKALCTEYHFSFLSVKGPELLSMYIGESEENIRKVFSTALKNAPCLIFFDELDSLAPIRSSHADASGALTRVVAQLLTEFDKLHFSGCSKVFVVAATNRIDLLDPALYRPGRFDKILYIENEGENYLNILKVLTKDFPLAENVDLSYIADSCPAHLTGADVYALSSEAYSCALTRCIEQQENTLESPSLSVTQNDFLHALKTIIPSLSPQEYEHYQGLKRQFCN